MHSTPIIGCDSKPVLVSEHAPVTPPWSKDKAVILFADICGSTALYDQLGNESALHIVISTLDILIRESSIYKGTVIKTIGDEIMCSFPDIGLALQAASAMHFAIDALQPGGKHAVNVRIGFHCGEVIHWKNDVYGDTVNIAARVTSITRARQTLTTQAVIDALPPDYADRVRPIMRNAFQGKQGSNAIFQILWEPDNKLSSRIGQPESRKENISNSNLLCNSQTTREYQI